MSMHTLGPDWGHLRDNLPQGVEQNFHRVEHARSDGATTVTRVKIIKYRYHRTATVLTPPPLLVTLASTDTRQNFTILQIHRL